MPKIYGNSEIWGDLLITGSFSILGSASTINTTNLVVSDPIISLGHSQSGTPILDEGFMFGRGSGMTQALIWDESDDTFAFVGTNDDHTVIGDININSYSNLRVGGLTTSTLTITNGAQNGYILQSDASGNATWIDTSSASLLVTSSNGLSTLGSDVRFGGTLSQYTSISLESNNFIINKNSTGFFGVEESSRVTYMLDSTFNSNILLGEISNTQNPELRFRRRIIGPAIVGPGGITLPNGSILGDITWTGNNNTSGPTESSIIRSTVDDTSNGITAELNFLTKDNTGLSQKMVIKSNGDVGIGTASPSYKLHVLGTVSTTGFRMTNGSSNGYVLQSDASGNATWVSATSISTNFANTDLTLNSNRLHDLNGNYIIIGDGTGGPNQGWLYIDDDPLGGSMVAGVSNNYYGADNNLVSIVFNGLNRINVNSTETIINENGNNVDFRVEGVTDSNLFSIDASIDSVSIGTSPNSSRKLLVSSSTHDASIYVLNQKNSNFTYGLFSWNGSAGSNPVAIYGQSTQGTGDVVGIEGLGSSTISTRNIGGLFRSSNGQNNYSIIAESTSSLSTNNIGLQIDVSGASVSNIAIVTNSGDVIINENGGDYYFRVEGDTDENLLFVDASTDRIGIGSNTPSYKLQVAGTVSSTTGFNTNGFDGWSGTFSADGQIVTVRGGIITNVV